MSKKSLRTAISLHERLTEGGYACGSYGSLTGDDRKEVFNAKLLELEPKLIGCPFCGDIPTYHPSTDLGVAWMNSTSSIECINCDIEFKGSYLGGIVGNWNYRVELKENK